MDAGFTCTAKLFHGTLALRYNDMMLGGKSRHQCMFTRRISARKSKARFQSTLPQGE